MKKKTVYLSIIILLSTVCISLYAQERPKLVVGIVIDQMRFDYLYRYQKYYGDGGFNRLMREGSNFTFAHYNYSQTSTALGHATIYTGTTPFYHGIIGNDWYDRASQKKTTSVSDALEKTVGNSDSNDASSPQKLLSTTITDQLKLATGSKSKVVSISIKDRSAILPGGHMADKVFWYDTKTGNFISSTYYMIKLPEWVSNFNDRKLADYYTSKNWELSLPEENYSISSPDDSKYEEDIFKEGRTSFPHSFRNLNSKQKLETLVSSPFGNMLLAEFAKSAIENENLGNGFYTDFLAISFSSTDAVGHPYGTNSFETQDTYIKLDSTLADLFALLDKKIGKENYLLFLTADHAAMDTPGFKEEKHLPAGGLKSEKVLDCIKSFTLQKFGTDNLIENYSGRQIYLNKNLIKEKNLNVHEIQQSVADLLRNNFDMISTICTRDQMEGKSATREPINTILNGFNPSISGDILFDMKPGLLPRFIEKGTTHGSAYSYDTHVPLLFYGWHIPKQTVNTPVYTVDIAATVADLLKIMEPSACIGIPLIK